MSILTRYKKPGGFEQLLELLETCDQAKQEKFLKLIEAENPRLGQDLHVKMLTVDKIFSWPVEYLGEVSSKMSQQNLAILFQGIDEETREKASATFSQGQKKNIERLMEDIKATPGQIAAAKIKLIETTRNLIKMREINIENIDPNLDTKDMKVA